MAHELETHDGTTMFADSRDDAWHQLGQQVGHLMTAEEVLRESHLADWNVRKEPLFAAVATAGDPEMVLVEGKYATVRDNPLTGDTDALGVVGSAYTPIQNEATAGFLNALVDETSGNAQFETAGSLRGGRETFVTMRFPEYMTFEGNGVTDRNDLYLAALNSHDGTSGFRCLVTVTRIVCANTQSAAISGAPHIWTVRHTANAVSAVEDARRSLMMAFTYVEAFEEQVNALIEAEREIEELRALADSIFQVEDADTERQKNARSAKVDSVMHGLSLPTQDGFGNTLYGLYNAVTENLDHFTPVKAKPYGGAAAYGTVFGRQADVKRRAFDLLTTAAR